MIPKYHIVHYKNLAIHYENGVYKIPDLPTFPFLTMTDAMRHIDEEEKKKKFFDNLKQANETN